MAKEKKMLVVIPARGGSRRLPRKNILQLAGKPTISWTIETALEAKLNAQIIVTSDDEEILEVASSYEAAGVTAYKRPDELATDAATTADVIKDAYAFALSSGLIPNIIVLLQPTSPLRSAGDILGAIELYDRKKQKGTVVSICEVEHPTAWTGSLNDECVIRGIDFSGKRSQEYAREYRLNGAVYIINSDHFKSSGRIFTEMVYGYEMPKDRSIDIDTEIDFKICEYMIRKRCC